jgi:hypothetical protein
MGNTGLSEITSFLNKEGQDCYVRRVTIARMEMTNKLFRICWKDRLGDRRITVRWIVWKQVVRVGGG